MQTPPPIRQGDILLIPTEQIPEGLESVARDEQGRVVLAEGEVTGHAHAILDEHARMFAGADLDEMADRFLRVEQEVRLVHEEHATLAIPAGAYIVRRKREYRPAGSHLVGD